MVWNQHSHRQLLLSPIPNHTERMWKLHQDVPGCSRDKHKGNSLTDIVVQLWTLKPHLHLAQKATTFPSPRLSNWSSNTKHLCKEFLQSAVWAMWSPFSSISQTALTTNISCHTFLLTWNASKWLQNHLSLLFFSWFNNKTQLQFGKVCQHHCTNHFGDVTVKGFSSPCANPNSSLEHHCTALPTQTNQNNARKDDKTQGGGFCFATTRLLSCSQKYIRMVFPNLGSQPETGSLPTLFLQCDRILLVPGKWKYPTSTQVTTCPLSSFCTGQCYRNSVLHKWKYNGYLALPSHPDLC